MSFMPMVCEAPPALVMEQELLHVPGAGRAALGAQAAVQADVLVLDHHAAGLDRRRHQHPAQVQRRRVQPPRSSASSPLR
jgi:hypothetical protein